MVASSFGYNFVGGIEHIQLSDPDFQSLLIWAFLRDVSDLWAIYTIEQTYLSEISIPITPQNYAYKLENDGHWKIRIICQHFTRIDTFSLTQ